LFDTKTIGAITSATYSVDIFFWLSGFLGTYLLLVEMKKKKGKSKPFVFVILHRILRLWPMYITTILLY